MSTVAMIRRLEPQDVAAILQIQASSREAAQWAPSAYGNILATGEEGWVASWNGELRGFLVARARAGEMEILNLAVAVDARRKGLGSALLREALAWGARSGVTRVFLEVRASNSSARRLYEAARFVPSGIRSKYYQDPVENALVFTRQLLQV